MPNKLAAFFLGCAVVFAPLAASAHYAGRPHHHGHYRPYHRPHHYHYYHPYRPHHGHHYYRPHYRHW